MNEKTQITVMKLWAKYELFFFKKSNYICNKKTTIIRNNKLSRINWLCYSSNLQY
jgi:hypothetical protein